MITSRQQNMVEYQNIITGYLAFEYVERSGSNDNKYKRHSRRNECGINIGNTSYYSLEKILSSFLLSKKLKTNTQKTITLLVVGAYCMVVKLGLSRSERNVGSGCSRINYLGRYLGLSEMKLQENGESYIMMSNMHCIICLT